MRRRISMITGACVLWGVVLFASAVAAAEAQSAQRATLSSSTTSCVASAGCSMTLSGTGFAASETVDLTLHSTPSSLGTVSANQNGDFVTTVTIPAGVAPGAHSIVAIGETSGDSASFSFTLTAETTTTVPATTAPPPSTTAPQAVPPSPSSTSGLPFTGADLSVLVALAAIAVAAGALALRTGRLDRRRRSGRVEQ